MRAGAPGYDDLRITLYRDPASERFSITIDEAGPRILIAGSLLLGMIRDGYDRRRRPGQTCKLDMPSGDWEICGQPGTDGSYRKIPAGQDGPASDAFTGALLHVYGTDRQMVWRITGFDSEHRAYAGEWPTG